MSWQRDPRDWQRAFQHSMASGAPPAPRQAPAKVSHFRSVQQPSAPRRRYADELRARLAAVLK